MTVTFERLQDSKILVIEDDADINSVISEYLTGCGATCVSAYSGTEAQLVLKDDSFDVIVSDLMLSGATGESIVSMLRESGNNTPIVVVSTRNTANDVIDLLSLGADDYVAKPFDLGVLAARVDAQLRKRELLSKTLQMSVDGQFSDEANSKNITTFGDWIIDADAMTLAIVNAENRSEKETIDLTRTEYSIVELLASQPNRVFTKQELYEAAWSQPYMAGDSSLNVHISNLRAKLKDSHTDTYIKTVWGAWL